MQLIVIYDCWTHAGDKPGLFCSSTLHGKKREKWEVTGPLCFGSLVADILLLHNPSIYKSGTKWSDLLRSCILNLEMPRTTLTLLWVKHGNRVDNYIYSNSDRRLRDVANSPTTTSINVAQLPVWHYSVWTDYTCRALNTHRDGHGLLHDLDKRGQTPLPSTSQ